MKEQKDSPEFIAKLVEDCKGEEWVKNLMERTGRTAESILREAREAGLI
jgi:predicted DNA-binding protein